MRSHILENRFGANCHRDEAVARVATLPNIAENDVWREGQVWSQIGPVNLSGFSTDMLYVTLGFYLIVERSLASAWCAALINGWTVGADVSNGWVAICIMSSSRTVTFF